MAPDPTQVAYPYRDKRGMSSFQFFVSRLLIDVFENYFRACQRTAFVGANQFFYYLEGDPRAVVEPDFYVVDDVSLHPSRVTCWKTWEHDSKIPSFALEIASYDEYRKGYADKLLERYQLLGMRELVVYDPERDRELFAHFVRDEAGQLVRRPAFGDRVQLVSYDVWLVRGAHDVLRLGVGPKGTSLWPTAAERAAAEAARAAAEAERADAEAERAAAEAERADAAQAELERLRAELAALRGR